jgi:ribosome-associated heat shock protein Hsp15
MNDGAIRVDKWLFQARFFKSRAAASRLVEAGRVRLDGRPIDKAHRALRPGDVLTFPQGREVRVIKVVALGARRGPASEARTLYEDLHPPGADGTACALPSPVLTEPAETSGRAPPKNAPGERRPS